MGKQIVCTVLKLLNEVENSRGKARLQIVQWNNSAPSLEKREYYTDENDEEKAGKAKGLNADDLRLIFENREEIEKIMEI